VLFTAIKIISTGQGKAPCVATCRIDEEEIPEIDKTRGKIADCEKALLKQPK